MREICHDRILRAFFQEDQDIGQPDILVKLASEIGLNGVEFKAALETRKYKTVHQQALEYVVPFARDAAFAAATIRAQLEQQGTPIGQIDVLIAGTTVALQATLVTHNVNEFSRVSEPAIVDWY